MKTIYSTMLIGLLASLVCLDVSVARAEHPAVVIKNTEHATVISFSLPLLAFNDSDAAGCRSLSAQGLGIRDAIYWRRA